MHTLCDFADNIDGTATSHIVRSKSFGCVLIHCIISYINVLCLIVVQ